jgi:hypothetical protein
MGFAIVLQPRTALPRGVHFARINATSKRLLDLHH